MIAVCNRTELKGTAMLHEGCMVLVVKVKGANVLMIDAGKLIPENWLGQEVSVTVEKKGKGN